MATLPVSSQICTVAEGGGLLRAKYRVLSDDIYLAIVSILNRKATGLDIVIEFT